MKKGKLYLIPNTLGGSTRDITMPLTMAIVPQFDHFIVEEIKSARRYLRAIGFEKDFDQVDIQMLNEHTKTDSNYYDFLKPCLEGHPIGLLSEAGVPCVADPGAKVVKAAHELGIQVVPLTGPSSILLTLMASGMNGQSFSFNGYLPREKAERIKKLKQLEMLAIKNDQTQLFMDAPYRNESLFEDVVNHLSPNTLLCIAADITMDTEQIGTKTLGEWMAKPPKIHKRPVMFALGKP